MSRVYYNDSEEYVCNWLANLMLAGLIPEGDIDQRSIRDVTPGDLRGYTQCHFFAGMGGWLRALQIAEWPADREVWTGSCPCQPFSVAGKQKGFDDERHLWPDFHRLIAERRPATVFGEQVAGASAWINLVRSDLEKVEYAVGVMPIEAASAGADHFRDRYFFVADRAQQQHGRWNAGTRWRYEYSDDGFSKLAHHHSEQPSEGLQRSGQFGGTSCDQGNNGRALSNNNNNNTGPQRRSVSERERTGQVAVGEIYSGSLEYGSGDGWGEGWTESEFRSRGFTAAVANIGDRQYIECSDGKWRRLPPPRVRWLGVKLPARVAKLRAIGNAIDPRPAAKFIKAYLEC